MFLPMRSEIIPKSAGKTPEPARPGGDLHFIFFRFPGVPGVQCAFQTRGGRTEDAFAGGNISLTVGDEETRAKAYRAALAPALGLERLAELKQVHGDDIFFEPGEELLLRPAEAPKTEGDGLASSRAGLGLLIKTADCQPVFLAHETGRTVAALHVGWRGNRMDFPGGAVRALCARYACAPQELFAARGPSLGPAAAEFIHFEREWGADYVPWFDAGRRCMDLWRLTRRQLELAGILPERIFGLDLCTASLPQFFSYRRDKITGRQANVIWRTEG